MSSRPSSSSLVAVVAIVVTSFVSDVRTNTTTTCRALLSSPPPRRRVTGRSIGRRNMEPLGGNVPGGDAGAMTDDAPARAGTTSSSHRREAWGGTIGEVGGWGGDGWTIAIDRRHLGDRRRGVDDRDDDYRDPPSIVTHLPIPSSTSISSTSYPRPFFDAYYSGVGGHDARRREGAGDDDDDDDVDARRQDRRRRRWYLRSAPLRSSPTTSPITSSTTTNAAPHALHMREERDMIVTMEGQRRELDEWMMTGGTTTTTYVSRGGADATSTSTSSCTKTDWSGGGGECGGRQRRGGEEKGLTTTTTTTFDPAIPPHGSSSSSSSSPFSPRRPSTPPRLLVGVPMPVVHMRTNSDFPGCDLPMSLWNTRADHPGNFDDAAYSECVVLEYASVLVPWDDDDDDGGRRDGYVRDDECDGRRSPIVVVIDGERYRLREVKEGAVMPRHPPSSSSSSSDRLSDRAYWLRSELRGAIYGRVRRGTVLRRLDPPVRVIVHKDDDDDMTIEAGWMSTSDHVAIKEISWDLVSEHGPNLAEDPIKEVAAMQYLQAFVRDERLRRRRRRGEDGYDDSTMTTMALSTNNVGMMDEEEEDVHVMMPLDLLSDETSLYSITPYCNGGRLLDRVERKGRFSEPEARHWMRQILKGLSCLKRAGVAHRDMSPENLMVHDDKVYIIDMGMCLRIPTSCDYYDYDEIASDDTMERHGWSPRGRRHLSRRSLILPQTPCGKWYYLSPEVCLSDGPFDGPAVDLWAAGVILFVMLTGSPPWEEPRLSDDNFRLMTAGHIGRMLEERRTGLSADAMDLLQSMLYLDPADRLSLEQVCAHPWMTHREHILP